MGDNWIQDQWEGSQAQQFMATNVDHKAEDLTKSAAKSIADTTKDTAIEISQEKATGAIPWLVGGVVTTIGFLLLEPIQWVTKNVFKGARKLVTGFGTLEKIPLIGGVFKFLGDAVEAVGEGVSYIVPVIAGIIGYKAFQTTPEEPTSTLAGKIKKTFGGIDQTLKDINKPGGPDGTGLEITPMAVIPASIQSTQAASERLAKVAEIRNLIGDAPVNAKPMLPAQRESIEQELGKDEEGKEAFKRIHKYLYGAEPLGNGVDERLTQERGEMLRKKIREVKAQIWEEYLDSGNKTVIKRDINAAVKERAGSTIGRGTIRAVRSTWIGSWFYDAPLNKRDIKAQETQKITKQHQDWVMDSDEIASRLIEELPTADPAAAATAEAQRIASQQIKALLDEEPVLRSHWQDWKDWASGKTKGVDGNFAPRAARDAVRALEADPVAQLRALEGLRAQLSGQMPLNAVADAANAEATASRATPAETNTPLAAAEVAEAGQNTPFFSTNVRPGFTGALAGTAALAGFAGALNPDATNKEKLMSAGAGTAGAIGAYVPVVADTLGAVGGPIIAYNKASEAKFNWDHNDKPAAVINGAEAVGGTAVAVGGTAGLIEAGATTTAYLGLGGAGLAEGAGGVAALANPVGAGLLIAGAVALDGYYFVSTQRAYWYIDHQFQKSDKFANLLSIQGRYIDEFIAKGGTTYDVEVDQGDGTKVIRKKIDYSNAANENIIREVIENHKKEYIDKMNANDSWRPASLEWTKGQVARDREYETAVIDLRVLNSAQEEIGGYGKAFRTAASHITPVSHPLTSTDTQNLGQFTSPLTPAQSDQPAIQAGKEAPAAPAKG